MKKNRVKLSTIVKNQLPQFVVDNYPLFSDFLTNYYESQEYVGSPVDILTNIDQYLKPENLKNVSRLTILRNSITDSSTNIEVDSTNGFPDAYGLIRIDDEIITYRYKTDTQFTDCIRGLSSIDSWNPDGSFIFSNTESQNHTTGVEVENLSVLFFDVLFSKLKKQFLPGFGENLSDTINQSNFLKYSKYFYKSKGTDRSFKILFKALFGEDVKVIRPSEFLFKPSNSFNKITKNIIVESLEGDPTQLVNRTLHQDPYLGGDNGNPDYGIKRSYGTVSAVEKIFLENKEYYNINIDSGYYRDISVDGTIYGDFVSHAKTKLIGSFSQSLLINSVIDVDSTLGFPNSGNLVINGLQYTYSGKSINQFYNVSGGTLASNLEDGTDIYLDAYAYGETESGLRNIKVRITPIISELKIIEDTYYMSSEDTAKIKSLGYESENIKANNWLFNHALKYEVKEVRSGNILDLYDKHSFSVGDKVKIFDNFGIVIPNATVISVDDENTIVISLNVPLIRGRSYKVERYILKNDINSNFSDLEKYSTNIQNSYVKSYNDDVLVASSSIPFYWDNGNVILSPDKKRINFWSFGTTIGNPSSGIGTDVIAITQNQIDHGFYTGDAVYYTPYSSLRPESDASALNFTEITEQNYDLISELDASSITQGVYYVKRVNQNSIKLSNSLADLYQGKYLKVYANIPQAYQNIFEYYPFYNKSLQPQNILREINKPVDSSSINKTLPGTTGIFINGVELLNYKSTDSIYYGELEDILVTSPGFGYDVINPPDVLISDNIGFGATAVCSVSGSLERIEILDPGFDYIDEPTIQITGGNGINASAKAEMKLVPHLSNFDSVLGINTITNTIGFSTYHKFKNLEKILYRSNGQQGVSGLVTDSTYFVSLVDFNNIRLHNSVSDANLGINTISLGFGRGIHSFETSDNKKIISRIVVENSGQNYQNKRRIISLSGINTASDSFFIKNHGYETRETIVYSTTGTEIGGLSTTTKYIVTKIDSDNFKLSRVGIGLTPKYDFFEKKKYVNITGFGTGVHSFNYEPIEVSVSGSLRVSPVTGETFDAKIQPIFRGSITSVNLVSVGSSYGTPDILNYRRSPLVEFSKGINAQVLPIVNNGKIVEVLVLNGGSGYKSPPNLIVRGSGSYEQLTPIIRNGELVDVKVIDGGIGFERSNTTIAVSHPGEGCKVETNIKKWTVNLFEKNKTSITSDDGFLNASINPESGLQYCHLYTPRKLRENIFVKNSQNEILYGVADLIQNLSGNEVNSTHHSPILGWAYDGSPIYGPYAYENPNGTGRIVQMRSGYTRKTTTASRPTISPEIGFFVEDYEFTNSGTLDENNGRFCVTPEYPNGVYAYFTTLTSITGGDIPFREYKIPEFPYVIGDCFKFLPNHFNFDKNSNQNQFDLNKTDWFRNTTPYSLKNNYSTYDYIFDPNSVKICDSEITYSSKGKIDGVDITSGGSGYKVNDEIIFEEPPTFTYPSTAKVTKISGKIINSIGVTTTSVQNIEFSPFSDRKYVGYSSSPHGFGNKNYLTISGLNTSFKNLQKTFKVEVPSNVLQLTVGVGSTGLTGLTTYFNVSGNLSFDNVRENDILGIGTERVKVLNVDEISSRIRVLREFGSTVGSSHSLSSQLTEISRKFYIDFNTNGTVSRPKNKEYYFIPQESLGIGSIHGVGIGTTISFSNPGVGITQIFIPTKSIFLEKHGLNTGDELIYSFDNGSPIRVSNGSSIFDLSNNQSLYALKISNNLIGVNTNRLPLDINNCLFFVGIGSGEIHSFKTRYENSLFGNVERHTATVSLASSHDLNVNDVVFLNTQSLSEKTIIIEYNDFNRRLVANPKQFVSSGIDTSNNTITVFNHGYKNGEKLIHVSTSPCLGLENNGIYYANVKDRNTISLSNDLYDSSLDIPVEIDINSQSFGTLYQVNPNIEVNKNQTIKFDLSHPSLSFIYSSTRYSAFEFKIYNDSNFISEFISSSQNNTFEVTKSGSIGISTSSTVRLRIRDKVPQTLFYRLLPSNNQFIPDVKKGIIIDNEIEKYSQINIIESIFNGEKEVLGIGVSSFDYDLFGTPEILNFDTTNSLLSYDTTSLTEDGAIKEVRITNSNDKYEIVPRISTIKTIAGRDAIIDGISTSIGKVKSSKIINNGFDFASDNTIRPFTIIPYTMKVLPLSSFERIDVIIPGRNYTVAPDLIVKDSFTNQIVSDVILVYELGRPDVRIFKNTSGFYNVPPKIIPINNSNGVGIHSVSFNNTTKDVVVSLASSFSTGFFPFAVGDKVLIENVSITGIDTEGRGYNSQNYNYDLFELTAINPQFGGFGATVTFNMNKFLSSTEYPGTYDPTIPLGRIISERDFPVFRSILKKNDFTIGETVEVIDSSTTGIVEKWNPNTEFLKVSSNKVIRDGDVVSGKTSKTKGFVRKVYHFTSEYSIGSSAIVNYGNQDDSGFLNSSTQRLHDNYYYQQFSYSLNSKKNLEEWSEIVDSLNHTSGFIKFSDLLIESLPDQNIINNDCIAEPLQNTVDVVNDIINVIDLESVPFFDIVTENRINLRSRPLSNRIIFKTKDLTDYFESIGNRVLGIDDISSQFNREPRPTAFSSVDVFDLSYPSKKYFVYVRDKIFYDERQLSVVSLLHDGANAYLNQYGRVETQDDLGSFDFRVFGSGGQLLFFPTKFTVNDYDISFVSYDLNQSISGIGSTVSLGDVAKITSSSKFTNTLSSTIVGISSNQRSAKIIVQHYDQFDNREFDEINIIHNGTDVEMLEYGQLTDLSKNSISSSGLGTYSAYISGSNVNLDFYPNAGLAVTTNAMVISIANSSFVNTSGEVLGDISSFRSYYANIPSSPSSFDTVIGSYFIGTSFNTIGAYDAAYFVVSIEDITNNEYQMSEVLVVNDFNIGVSRINFVEYGSLYTDSPLGIISCRQNIDKVELLFNQKPNANIQVRTFGNMLKLKQQETSIPEVINLNNSRIITSDANYQGTDSLVKYSFNLTHNQNEIFQRQFVGNSTSVIDLQNNYIRLPNHYFTTGEKLSYSVLTIGGSPIGIATTSIVGVGTTDLLPSTVYAIKVNESLIRLAGSAENALKPAPIALDLTSVGIGSSHILKSEENKNSRVLVSIDNIIQSPLVSVGVSERLINDIGIGDLRLTLSGITSFASFDLIKIDNEIMRINSVGFGSTNVISVSRPWMGTGVSTHTANSVVTKLKGSYNIVENYIHFSEPPRGLVPPETNDFKSIFNLNYNTVTGLTTVTTVFENDFSVNEQVVIAGSNLDAFNGYFKVIATDNIRNFTLQLPTGIVGIPSGDLYVYSPLSSSPPDQRDWSGIASSSKFHGRVFMKSGKLNTVNSTYSNNYVFDDITDNFNAIDRTFTLRNNGQNISGISTSNAIVLINNIFQGPQSTLNTPQNYSLTENNVGITSINFIGAATSSLYDPNNASIPVGGVIVSVGSTYGFGYQPLVSAGGTAVVSVAGTIQSISIGNSGSGYRSGIQTTVNVSVAYTASSLGISTTLRIGIASVLNGNVVSVAITNPGIGYTSTNPPLVIFDEPLSYTNIPLIYSSSSSGLGTQATVDVVVGQGSSVINFEIKNTGYGYKPGEILTISTVPSVGIPTVTGSIFQEFRLTIDEVYQDDFNGWFIGDMIVLDEINNLFDGSRTQFPLSIDGNLIAIKSRPGSNIDIQSTLLVFVNDILQVPNEGYVFDGGSIITFTEPLKPNQPGIQNSGDRCRIMFYKGNGDIDVLLRDVIETVKIGDGLRILENESTCRNSTDQDTRIVYDILSSDLAETNVYSGPGINGDPNCLRGVTWSRQREDVIINGIAVGKDRLMYEPIINPFSNLIQPVSTSSTVAYVQNIKTIFDPVNEDLDQTLQKKLTLVSQADVQSAICTAFISTTGIITGISILNGGRGYSFVPEISIESPSGVSTNKATAIASISAGIVTNITITNAGSGYTYAPSLLIQSPVVSVENLNALSYTGDFGKIVGIATTSFVGVSTGLNFDLFIPPDNSFLMSTSIVGTAITVSRLQVGDFFSVYNTNVGNSVTSLYNNGAILGIGTEYLDNVYQVAGISSVSTSVLGYGVTVISRVTVNISDYNGFVGIASTSLGGDYSWGKVLLETRLTPKQFVSYNTNGVTGIKTSDILMRSTSLKFIEYNP